MIRVCDRVNVNLYNIIIPFCSDFEQQLSPFVIQNSCDDEQNQGLEPTSPAQDVVIQDTNETSNSSNEVVEDAFDMLDFEQNVVPGFINDNTFQTGESLPSI